MTCVTGIILASCAHTTQAQETNAWAQEFQRIHDTASSPVVRSIVEDGQLTLAEMREVAALTNECFQRVGSPAVIQEDERGGFMNILISEPANTYPSEEIRVQSIECEMTYWNDLWILWDLVRLNPDAEDFEELIVDCLNRNNLSEDTVTVQIFREASQACSLTIDSDTLDTLSDEELSALFDAHWELNQDCRPQLPCGLYLDEGLARECQLDPVNTSSPRIRTLWSPLP